MMPADRLQRMQRLFRRFGIPDDSSESNSDSERNDALKDLLLPINLDHPELAQPVRKNAKGQKPSKG